MNENESTNHPKSEGTNVTPDKVSSASSNAISKVEEANSIKSVGAKLELGDTMN